MATGPDQLLVPGSEEDRRMVEQEGGTAFVPEEPQGSSRRRKGPRSVTLEISNEIVQLHRKYYGKGPTRAKTYIKDDLVVCLLRDIFTTVEQTLLEVGNAQHVRETRYIFQQAMETRFRAVVERATGQKVIAFMSETHIGPDMAAEIFLLEPRDNESQTDELS
jgi:uncharacterized protein YbcI